MERVKFIEHKGKRILHLDFSNLSGMSEVGSIISTAKPIISKEPPGSVLTLSDFSGSMQLKQQMSDPLKEFTKHNKPYVKAGAVLGVSGLMQVVFSAVLVVSGRSNLKLFSDPESAKNWLAGV